MIFVGHVSQHRIRIDSCTLGLLNLRSETELKSREFNAGVKNSASDALGAITLGQGVRGSF